MRKSLPLNGGEGREKKVEPVPTKPVPANTRNREQGMNVKLLIIHLNGNAISIHIFLN
jgi:hypothetical protein